VPVIAFVIIYGPSIVFSLAFFNTIPSGPQCGTPIEIKYSDVTKFDKAKILDALQDYFSDDFEYIEISGLNEEGIIIVSVPDALTPGKRLDGVISSLEAIDGVDYADSKGGWCY
jgi:hypothetical protein